MRPSRYRAPVVAVTAMTRIGHTGMAAPSAPPACGCMSCGGVSGVVAAPPPTDVRPPQGGRLSSGPRVGVTAESRAWIAARSLDGSGAQGGRRVNLEELIAVSTRPPCTAPSTRLLLVERSPADRPRSAPRSPLGTRGTYRDLAGRLGAAPARPQLRAAAPRCQARHLARPGRSTAYIGASSPRATPQYRPGDLRSA